MMLSEVLQIMTEPELEALLDEARELGNYEEEAIITCEIARRSNDNTE